MGIGPTREALAPLIRTAQPSAAAAGRTGVYLMVDIPSISELATGKPMKGQSFQVPSEPKDPLSANPHVYGPQDPW